MSEFDEHNHAGQSAENTQQESPVQDIIARTQEIMADLKAKKQEMLDADAALEKAHESKREIMRKVDAEHTKRREELNKQLEAEYNEARENSQKPVTEAADMANLAAEAYREARDAAIDPKRGGLLQRSVLDQSGFPPAGPKRK